MMSNIIHAEVPDQLWQQAQTLIQQGWANNLQEVINESLRRYLESHQDLLSNSFIQEDVLWGLKGDD
jgi:Arc/MetJ-type ribon-helix-helix transcriptional regulator